MTYNYQFMLKKFTSFAIIVSFSILNFVIKCYDLKIYKIVTFVGLNIVLFWKIIYFRCKIILQLFLENIIFIARSEFLS